MSKPQKHVRAEFELPEEFVKIYNPEIVSWGRDFQRRGPHCLIVLRHILRKPVLLDGNGQIPQIGVRLVATVERARRGSDEVQLRVHAESSEDLYRIHKHLEDVKRWGPPLPPVGRPKSRPSVEVPIGG